MWSDQPSEGVVVRPVEPAGAPVRVAKLVRAGFVRLTDDAWRHGRPINPLAASAR